MRTLVDPKDLPKPYGGELDWKYEDEPAIDEDTKEAIGEMAKGPAIFVDGQLIKPPFTQSPKPNGETQQ